MKAEAIREGERRAAHQAGVRAAGQVLRQTTESAVQRNLLRSKTGSQATGQAKSAAWLRYCLLCLERIILARASES